MYPDTTQIRLILSLSLVLFASASAASEIDQLSKTRSMEKWGRVLFCQRIYQLPQVMPRLYDFDVERCDKAEQLMESVVMKYSAQEQQQMKYQAERHAQALSFNTSEPYHSVGACRSYCSELAAIQDKRNDQ